MLPGEPLAAPFEECLSGGTDQIGHLQRWPAHLRFCGRDRQHERVQRTGGGAELPRGQMEVNGRLLQVAVTQQQLDGA
jgi:hypothetical protein